MKLLISAGEPSGDQRGAEVLRALKERTEVQAFGLGGECLGNQGMELTGNMSNYAVMGFTEILGSLGKFLKLEKKLAVEAEKKQPDCILLVDYPGFNMRLGRRMKKAGFPVIHFVAPQMWAWGGWRVKKLTKSSDLLLTLFRFEEEFFKRRGVNAIFSGHPLKDRIVPNVEPGKALGLLPGSRAQEVSKLLPEMLNAFTRLRNARCVHSALLAVSNHLDSEIYAEAANTPGVKLLQGTEAVLRDSRAALVCSGTATLETALYGVPFVVCYKTGKLTYAIARNLVRGINRIGMANIVAETDVAPELIQKEATASRMAELVKPLLTQESEWKKSAEKLKAVAEALGEGDAAGNTAENILKFIGAQNEQ